MHIHALPIVPISPVDLFLPLLQEKGGHTCVFGSVLPFLSDWLPWLGS